MGVTCGKPTDWVGNGRRDGCRWKTFYLEELKTATNKFNYDNKLGEGGFASVYWGQLSDASQIAVKRLKDCSDKAQAEFEREVEILGRARHGNILNLRGYCAEGEERLIVYDYMPNSSLFSHLHGLHSVDSLLDWSRRMSIAIGSAEGIAYLHHRARPCIIHGDIKSSNILLDSEFHAHVADFRSAKLIEDCDTCIVARCDIYSFGVLLLELATGRKPVEKLSPAASRTIVDWALPLVREKRFDEMADPRLDGSFVEAEMKRVVIVALTCARSDLERRPTMLEVVELLKGKSKEKLSSLENVAMLASDGEDDSAADVVASTL